MYNVIFDGNGHTDGNMSPQIFYYGMFNNLSYNNYIKTGYNFAGWSTTPSGSILFLDGEMYMLINANNVTLYAIWTPITYTITLNAGVGVNGSSIYGWEWNGVTYSYAKAFYASTQASTLPADPYKTGYTFVGWYEYQNGTGIIFNSLSTIIENAAYYAKWAANNYYVTLNATGGTGGTTGLNIDYNQPMPILNAPTRTGYTFVGFYDQENGMGTQYYAYDMTSTKVWDKAINTTLYAHWTPNIYTVNFNGNGSNNGSMSSQNFAYTVPQQLAQNAYTRTGYTFTGWSISPSGIAIFSNGATCTLNSPNDVTLYAIWQPEIYTINYNANGGTVSGTTTFEVAYDSMLGSNNMPPNPTRALYTFASWNTSPSGSGMTYTQHTVITGGVILYAIWLPN